jgi:cell division septation protein DedD
VGSDLASIEKADQAGESKVLGVLAPTGQDLKSQAGKYAGYMATKPEPAKKPEAAAPAPSKPAAQPSAGSPAPAKPAAKPEPNPLVEDAKARAEAHQQRIDAESKGQQEFSEIQKRMAALNATG